jgi:hypothetical protein
MIMTTALSKFSLGLFFALSALVFAPLGSFGPTDILASEVDEGIKEAVDEQDVDKEAIKDLEDKVKLIREDIEKKMEKRLAEMFKDEEMLDAVARLKEAEDELAKNGGDTWFDRPFAPKPFFVRQPRFFPRVFNPFRVRPMFFFDDDNFFFRERFFGEEEEDD